MGDFDTMDFKQFIRNMAGEYKSKHGEWVFDLEALDDMLEDPCDDEHFDKDLFEV
jgi:hypothetical protein